MCRISTIISLFFLFGLALMGAKYKQIDFNSFKDGEGFDFVGEQMGYKAASNVTINEETGKLTLGNALSAISLPAPITQISANNAWAVMGTSFLVWAWDDTGLVSKIYKSTGTTLTLVKTLSATFGFAQGMAGNGKIAFIFSSDDSANGRFAYTIDEGATWTESTQTIFDQYRGNFVLLGEYIYFNAHIKSGNYGIVRTRDGSNFEIVWQANSASVSTDWLVEADGVIYAEVSGSIYKLVNNQLILIQKEKTGTIFSNGHLYLMTTLSPGSNNPTRVKFYTYDGARFVLTKDFIFPNQIQIQGFYRDITNGYILCGVVNGNYNGFNTVVFRVGENDDFHFFQALNYANEEMWDLFVFNKNIYYIDAGANLPQIQYGANYILSGTMETSAVNEGEIIPKQLILRHDPLTANTSIKIYAKKDFASSWTLLLTSNTTGAIKKKYNFANNYGIADFMEFKVELITTLNTISPKFLSLKLLYVPVGLEHQTV